MAGDGRFSRFRNLEQERPAKPSSSADAPASTAPAARGAPAKASRFDGLETAGPNAGVPTEAPTPSAAGHLARFDAPKQDDLAVSRESDDAQPFLRCRACEGDNNRYARTCIHCTADLATPEQRAFNEKLWADRRAQQVAEREAHQQHLTAQLQAEFDLKQQQRAAAEELAREAGRRARANLESDDDRLGLGLLFASPRSQWERRAFRKNPVVGVVAFGALAVLNLFTHRPWLYRVLPLGVVGLVVLALFGGRIFKKR